MGKSKNARTRTQTKRPTKSKKKRPRKLDERARADRRFKTDIRTSFVNAGFRHVPTRDISIEVSLRTSDFDAVFLFENILVISEDTTLGGQRALADHLRKKNEFYQHIQQHQEELIATLKRKLPPIRYHMAKHHLEASDFVLAFIYCSTMTVDEKYQERYGSTIRFIDRPKLQYFLHLSKTINRSARFEILKFLGLELDQIGLSASTTESSEYQGLLLPETPSGLPQGHDVVSFLVDPNMLLERSYVLRTDSWRDTECLYQRLLKPAKLKSMREYLVKNKRVFINNIIATLPPDAQIIEGKATSRSRSHDVRRIRPVRVIVPRRFNAIGLIDGQHRLFAYHEGSDKYEKSIEPLRSKQHLLVTAIQYPPKASAVSRQRFEAKLFLDINDKQTRVKSDLRQSIKRIVEPFSTLAIAKAVIEKMAATGPLTGLLEVHFFDRQKIKTASIVSYGLQHIVRLDSDSSLYKLWPARRRNDLTRGKDIGALNKYIDFCADKLNTFIAAFKTALPDTLWTNDKRVSRVLTTTTINGLIFCVRRLVENELLRDYEGYRSGFKKLRINFQTGKFAYKSSHWKDLGEKMYTQCFE